MTNSSNLPFATPPLTATSPSTGYVFVDPELIAVCRLYDHDFFEVNINEGDGGVGAAAGVDLNAEVAEQQLQSASTLPPSTPTASTGGDFVHDSGHMFPPNQSTSNSLHSASTPSSHSSIAISLDDASYTPPLDLLASMTSRGESDCAHESVVDSGAEVAEIQWPSISTLPPSTPTQTPSTGIDFVHESGQNFSPNPSTQNYLYSTSNPSSPTSVVVALEDEPHTPSEPPASMTRTAPNNHVHETDLQAASSPHNSTLQNFQRGARGSSSHNGRLFATLSAVRQYMPSGAPERNITRYAPYSSSRYRIT